MSVLNKVVEAVPPRFTRRQGDIVSEGSNNTILIIGTDRPGNAGSGYGHVHAAGYGMNSGIIHAIAGRKNHDPNFKTDASFIYIAQRTDADKNLNLPDLEGNETRPGAVNKPAAIIKSDNIRLVFRDDGDFRVVNDAGSTFIVVSKDYIDSHVGSDLWIDVGGVKFEVHEDKSVRLGPLAQMLNDLGEGLKKAISQAATVSLTGNLGAPVPFGGSDLQIQLLQAISEWQKRIEGDYIV